ncbi:DUF4340 domain-containing protein [candidate division KSB1 bacterium]|nr:DUF4340 domain-containing protein [candidate division KSB1 bacterium]
MKQKNLYYLAGTVFVLLIIYFITKPRFTSTNIDEIIQSIVIGVSEQDVGIVEVYKEAGDKKVELKFTKTGDDWRMPGYMGAKARKSDVERLIKDILEMQGKVRATGENYFDQFKIQDQQGVHLLLKDEADKPLVNLILGKKGDDYGTGFIRFMDKNKIFFADKNILNSLKIYTDADTLTTFKPSSFVELTAFEYNKDELETIALIKGNQELVVRKIEKEVTPQKAADDTSTAVPVPQKVSTWVIEKAGQQIEIDPTEADKFVNEVRKLTTQKLVDRMGQTLNDMNKPAKYGLNRPTGGVVFIKKENQRVQSLFGREYEKDKGYYFQCGDDGLIYEVTKTTFDNLFKWIEELPKKKV